MVEAAFVAHFPIPPIYPYLPFTPGYLMSAMDIVYIYIICLYIHAHVTNLDI